MSKANTYDLLVYGFGGHGLVLIELAKMLGYHTFGVFDDNTHHSANNMPEGVAFLGKYDAINFLDVPLVIAIGSNEVRMNIAKRLMHQPAILIHPSAVVSPSTVIGPGTVVLANAVVQANTRIGSHCILNAGAVIDHDVKIGDFVHVRPLSYIGSNASLSRGLTIEPGQIVERFVVL